MSPQSNTHNPAPQHVSFLLRLAELGLPLSGRRWTAAARSIERPGKPAASQW